MTLKTDKKGKAGPSNGQILVHARRVYFRWIIERGPKLVKYEDSSWQMRYYQKYQVV